MADSAGGNGLNQSSSDGLVEALPDVECRPVFTAGHFFASSSSGTSESVNIAVDGPDGAE